MERGLGDGDVAADVHHQSPHLERASPLLKPLALKFQHAWIGRQPAEPLPIGHPGRLARWRGLGLQLGLSLRIRLGLGFCFVGRLQVLRGRYRQLSLGILLTAAPLPLVSYSGERVAGLPDDHHCPANQPSAAGTSGQSSLKKTTNH